MTTQSLPISRTRRDYIISVIVSIVIIISAVLSIYFLHPQALSNNAKIKIFGIQLPNFQGIIMRQPRMTVIIILAALMTFVGFIFIRREALTFFSRPLAWASVGVSVIAMLAIGFLTDSGKNGSWFRFLVLCVAFTGGATVLAEIMIFYRQLFKDSQWRTGIVHSVVFALVVGLLTGAMSFSYYHFGMKDGAVLNYRSQPIQQYPTPGPSDKSPSIPGMPDLSAPNGVQPSESIPTEPPVSNSE